MERLGNNGNRNNRLRCYGFVGGKFLQARRKIHQEVVFYGNQPGIWASVCDIAQSKAEGHDEIARLLIHTSQSLGTFRGWKARAEGMVGTVEGNNPCIRQSRIPELQKRQQTPLNLYTKVQIARIWPFYRNSATLYFG